MNTSPPIPVLSSYLGKAFCNALRLSSFAVLGFLLYFPLYKSRLEGYVPIMFGAGLAWSLAILFRKRFWIDQLRTAPFLALLLGIPAALQFILIIAFRSSATFDAYLVIREASRLLETGSMNPMTYFAPGQTWYFSLFFTVFGVSDRVAQFAQVPLAAVLPLLIYLCGRHAGPEYAARRAGLTVALYPSLLLYILVTPYYFYLYSALMLVMILSWIQLQADPTRRLPPLWGGVAAGAGALTKAVLLVAPVQMLFFLLANGALLWRRQTWRAWMLFSLAMGLTLAPWVVRNLRVFGEPVLICTSGPLVFYSANNPYSDGLYHPLPDQVRLQSPQEMLAHGRWCKEQALAFIRSQPGAFLRLAGRKLLHTWGTETTFVELINRNGRPIGAWDPALRLASQTGWAALVLSWVWASVQAMRRRRPATPLEISAGIVIFSTFLVYSVYEGGARHHLPAVPLLILLVMSLSDTRKHNPSLGTRSG